MKMNFKRKLPIPLEVKNIFPVNESLLACKRRRDDEIKRIFTGECSKFLLIIGPCSADKEDSVIDYVSRLALLQQKVQDRILIIPRVYTSKPRTTGVGYKGMLHQPDPLLEEDMLEGIISVRKLHTKIIQETELTCADELLYPENYRYLSDLLSYVAIGARSVENQQHRLVASGIDIPVGMKNPICGNLNTMVQSILAAQHSHTFIYRGWEVVSEGNPFAHAILRGETDRFGNNYPNYHYEDINRLYTIYVQKKLKNMSLIIDVNHSNSGKNHLEQMRICREIVSNRRRLQQLNHFVKGLMIESYIVDGSQTIDGSTYGQSITDPCLGWEKTKELVLDLAEML